jgi:hypothetical protein
MKQIVSNLNNTFTIYYDNWSVTANSTQLEELFNKQFGISILPFLKEANKY